jgi:hypothetical protein
MYGIYFTGSAEGGAPGLCETYQGMIYEVYSTRRHAEREIESWPEPWRGNYRVVPLPSYPGPETELCDPMYRYPLPEEYHQGVLFD